MYRIYEISDIQIKSYDNNAKHIYGWYDDYDSAINDFKRLCGISKDGSHFLLIEKSSNRIIAIIFNRSLIYAT